MNKQELIERIKCLDEPYLKQELVFKWIEQLDEPQPIKLKDVIARIQELDLGTQKVWLNEILNELGSDYGTLKYKDGYEQGKFEGGLVPFNASTVKKPVVPQFVADWIKYSKNTFLSLTRALMVNEVDFYNYANQEDHSRLMIFLESKINQETFALAWINGYTVEKEKRYLVKMKGISSNMCYLNRVGNKWIIAGIDEHTGMNIYTKHTKKQLEEAGFGEVFDSPLFEIEEVEV